MNAHAGTFATSCRDPWCPGCGHAVVMHALQDVLARVYSPRDVILVTDIGCIGMADALFTCHTVHGLHGRAPALAAGIAMNIAGPERKKVVALMGDGGAAIGLQHVLECARLNVDLTLIVCNNQNYGMTGGQHSAYTATGVRTTTTPAGHDARPYALCELAAPLGVLRSRVLATSPELGTVLERSLAHRGFALVETMNYCPAYAGKLNPDSLTPREMRRFLEAQGFAFGTWGPESLVAPVRFTPAPKPPVLQAIPVRHAHALSGSVDVLVAGSAGEGVQTAAELFARAALMSGLHVAVRGEYPVTVGKGFSCNFLRLADAPIGTSVTETYDVALVTSADGQKWLENHVQTLRTLVLDASLPGAADARLDVRRFGAKQAAFAALAWLVQERGLFPLAALRDAVGELGAPKVREGLTRVLDALSAPAG